MSLEADACGDRGPRAARAARQRFLEGAERGRVDFFAGRKGPLEGAAKALDTFAYVNQDPDGVNLDRDFLPALEMLRRTARGRYLPETGVKALTTLARRFGPEAPGRELCLGTLRDWWRDGLLEVVREGRTLQPGSADLGRMLAEDVALVQRGRLVFEAPARLSDLGLRQAQELRSGQQADPHLASRLQGDTVEALLAAAEARESREAVEALTAVVKASAGDPSVRTALEPYRERLGQVVSRTWARQNLGGRQVDAGPEAAYLREFLQAFPEALDEAGRVREVLPLLFPRLDGLRTPGAFELAAETPGLAPVLLAEGRRLGMDGERYRILAGAVARGEWLPSREEVAWVASQVAGLDAEVFDKRDTELAGTLQFLARVRERDPELLAGLVPGQEALASLVAAPPAQAAERLYAPAGPLAQDMSRVLFPDPALEQELASRLEAAWSRAGSLHRLDAAGEVALALAASALALGLQSPEGGLEERLAGVLDREAFRPQRTEAAEFLAGRARERDVQAARSQPLEERLEVLLGRRASNPEAEPGLLRAWRSRVAAAGPEEARHLAGTLFQRFLPDGTPFELGLLEALGEKAPEVRDRMLAELGVRVADRALGPVGANLLGHAQARLRSGTLPPSGQALCLRALEASARASSGWTPFGASWTSVRDSWQKGLQGWMAGLPRLAGDEAWQALGALADAAAPGEPEARDLELLGDVFAGLRVAEARDGAERGRRVGEACELYRDARALLNQGRSWEEARFEAGRRSLVGGGEPQGPGATIQAGEGEVRIGGLTLPIRNP